MAHFQQIAHTLVTDLLRSLSLMICWFGIPDLRWLQQITECYGNQESLDARLTQLLD